MTNHFTIRGERDDLASALETATRFTSGHSTSPVLGHLHLVLNEDACYVEASDQRMAVRTHLWASADEPVDVTAHTNLAKAARAMPSGPIEITLRDGKKELEVSGKGRARYTVALGDGAYPDVLPRMDQIAWDDIDPVDTADAIATMELAARYVSKTENNPSLTGVNLRVDNDSDELVIESTDGYRLFQDRIALPVDGFPFNEEHVLLPVRMVRELGKLFPGGEVRFAADSNLFFASDPAGNTYFAARRIGGKFPDVDRIIPDYGDDGGSVTIPLEEMRAVLSRTRFVAGGKPVNLEITKDGILLRTRGDISEAEEWVPASSQTPIQIAFNGEHLSSVLEAFPGDEVTCRYLTPLRPMTVTDGGKRRMTIMPVKYS